MALGPEVNTQLQEIVLKPGINKNNTSYGNEGGWIDGDKVRFSQGNPEKLGGWSELEDNSYPYRGVAREAITWNALNGDLFYALGTHNEVAIYSGGQFYDITPVRAQSTETSAINTYLNNTSVVKVSDAGHGGVS